MKVTIRDIAQAAGVSAASVSLVLNNKPSRITEETRERILNAAKELGYIRKEKKEAVVGSSGKVIGVIHPDMGNLFINQCVEGIENYAAVYGHNAIVCDVQDSSKRCAEYLSLFSRLNVDGIIVIPPLDMNINNNNILLGNALKQTKVPFILLDRAIDRVFCDFITSDNKQGAYMATEHLIYCGHENIGIIAGMREVYNGRKRIEGYKEALAFYNISINQENIYYGDFHHQSGYEGAEYFWKKGIRAIFACSDDMAMGVYQFAREHGLTIGEDISVVGFDDNYICKRVTPALTSISQSGAAMGKKACEMVIKRVLKLEDEAIRDIYFTPRLIERNSVKIINKEVLKSK
jgi:DNA-binding LacI/PurR family transcriptional regulator